MRYLPALNSAMHLYTLDSSLEPAPYFNPNTCDQFSLRYYTSPYSLTPSYPSPPLRLSY